MRVGFAVKLVYALILPIYNRILFFGLPFCPMNGLVNLFLIAVSQLFDVGFVLLL